MTSQSNLKAMLQVIKYDLMANILRKSKLKAQSQVFVPLSSSIASHKIYIQVSTFQKLEDLQYLLYIFTK